MIIILPLLFLNLLFGYLDELRDYYEAYPIVLLLAWQTAIDFVGTRDPARIVPARGQS